MIDLVTWALLVVGIVYAITTSFVFTLPRILISRIGLFAKYFIYCPWCVSFWVGIGLSFFLLDSSSWQDYLLHALASGAAAMGLISVLKAAFPTLLVPPFEAEQGEVTTELKVAASSDAVEPQKCPHRYTNVGPDRRCILCGADEA